jgi:hypothetical protein
LPPVPDAGSARPLSVPAFLRRSPVAGLFWLPGLRSFPPRPRRPCPIQLDYPPPIASRRPPRLVCLLAFLPAPRPLVPMGRQGVPPAAPKGPFTSPAVPRFTGRGVRPDLHPPLSLKREGIQRYRPPTSSSTQGGAPGARERRPRVAGGKGSDPQPHPSSLKGPRTRTGGRAINLHRIDLCVDPTRIGRARPPQDPGRAGGTSEGSANLTEGQTTKAPLTRPARLLSLDGGRRGRGGDETPNTATAGLR